MGSLESVDFSSFIIFSDDPWSLLVSFCQLFKLPLVVQCCNVICEWPLIINQSSEPDVRLHYYVLYPAKNIMFTLETYLVVAIAVERYLAVCRQEITLSSSC